MALSEKQHISLVKREIEKKFSFGNGNGYTQRDLEVLSRYIEEKTGVLISLSTLKRIWKDDYKQSPQIATLNALSVVLDYKNWQEFKQHNPTSARFSLPGKRWILAGIAVASATLAFLLAGLGNQEEPRLPKVNGPVHFSTKKTVTSGIPNTVIFNYDLSNVKADSFFIQQTWNDFHKEAIDPKGKAYTSIYFESGYHRARLLANDSAIAMQPVHILSDGWEPHIYYSYEDREPIAFKNETFLVNGQLHLEKSLLERRNVDFSRYFFTRISNSQEFNVSSDNFSLVTRMKLDSMMNTLCPWMELIVVTERHIFWVYLKKQGCEHSASYKLGEIRRYGKHNDLSALGVDVFEWQELGIHVEDKSAEIHLNGKTAFQQTFKEDFGKVVGLIYIFEGTGSLDYVKMEGADGQTVFEDDFEG